MSKKVTNAYDKFFLPGVMKNMGFVSQRSRGERGYNVVAYSGAEITLNRSLMAKEAKPEDEVSAVSHEALLDAFDTLF